MLRHNDLHWPVGEAYISCPVSQVPNHSFTDSRQTQEIKEQTSVQSKSEKQKQGQEAQRRHMKATENDFILDDFPKLKPVRYICPEICVEKPGWKDCPRIQCL